MALTTTAQVLYDGSRQAHMQFTGVSDGSGELSQATIVNCKALSGQPVAVNIRHITADVDYGIVELFWDAEIPVKFAELSGPNNQFDYDEFGGLLNNAALGRNGNILMSTVGFSNGSTYTLKLDMVKKYS